MDQVHQVQLMHKFQNLKKEMILSNEAQTKYLEDLGCEVKGKRFGDSLVLVCHVDQVEKRSQGGQFGHKNTSIGESETP